MSTKVRDDDLRVKLKPSIPSLKKNFQVHNHKGHDGRSNATIILPNLNLNGRVNYSKHSYSDSTSESEDSGQSESSREGDNGNSSDSSDCMEPIIVKTRKKIKRDHHHSPDSGTGSLETASSVSVSVASSSSEISDKTTAPVSPANSRDSTGSNETRLLKPEEPEPEESRDGSKSPETPEGEWEIEEIRDYVRDDFGEQYLVKWKDWEESFNTWEPPDNLRNCDQEKLKFFRLRKRLHQEALDSSVWVDLPNGRRRRKGPVLLAIPPDPRPLDQRVQDFFDHTGCVLSDKDIVKVFKQWKTKKLSSKFRWSRPRIDKGLQDAVDGKLTKEEIKELTNEIILLEVEKKDNALKAEMKEWEGKINKITGGRPYITVENEVDMSGPPIKFQFVNEYVAGKGIVIPKDPPVGCDCGKKGSNCYDERSKCCAMQCGYKYAYTKHKKVNLMLGSPIYECNSKCKCGPECLNRVVQDGRSDHKLCIFRTSNDCGWGVKTLKPIKKGSFVTLYVGEVIKSEEAERRGKIYDKNGCSYLFDLDFNDPDDYPYSVDACDFGNVSHFINHSCNPNLGVYAVWINCLDPNLPNLAMFALRDIAKNEELTFDYSQNSTSETESESRPRTGLEEQDQEDNDGMHNKGKKTLCRCGSKNCRKYVFY